MEDIDSVKVISFINQDNFLTLQNNNNINVLKEKNTVKYLESQKGTIEDFSEKNSNYKKILNMDIKNKYTERKQNTKFKKEDIYRNNDNRIPYFYKRENSMENSPSSKLSKNSSIKIIKESLEVDYNKLKIELMPCLDNYSLTKNIKKKINELALNKNKKITKDNKKIKLLEKYKNHINFGNKKKYFIILFIIGIFLSVVDLVLSVILVLYGNQEIFSLFIVLNILVIFLYVFGIYFMEKNYSYTLEKLSKLENPEKIEHSIHRNNIYLFIYFLMFALNYYLSLVSGFTIFKNNIKIDIRGKGYDRNKWKYYFKKKTFNQVVKEFDKINLIFISFCWLSITLIITILSFFIYVFNSYQFWKRIIENICLLFGQISFLIINISAYCFNFRHITFLGEYTMAWVITGLIIVGFIGFVISFYGFWIFYSEIKKHIKIFNYLCFFFFIATAVFAAKAKEIGLKFDDYKKASCNNIFKYISEDYLMKNNDCSSKYLFNHETLNDIICPKERIMINWELTEKKTSKEKVVYGCINQSCCLKVYCKIKTGFNYQEILGFNQLILYIILFISGKYMEYKVDKIIEEEIIEKFNNLITISFTLLIYIICFLIIMFRAPTSNQSIFNDIKGNEIDKDLTIIDKNWLSLTDQNILMTKSNELWDEFSNFIDLNITINNNYNDSIFNFEYYDYYLYSEDVDIIINNEYKNDSLYYNYVKISTNRINFHSGTNIIDYINKYFYFNPYSPFNQNNTIFLSLNLIYSINQDKLDIDEEIDNIKNFTINTNIDEDNITISQDLILFNYNRTLDKSVITLLKNKEILLINNNTKSNITSFYIKGNVYNDTGSSLINIYNYYYKNNPIYSEKANMNGEFSIGPFYYYEKNTYSFELDLQIYKLKYSMNGIYEIDDNYNNYTTTIKIGGFGFNPNYPFSLMKNILLPSKKKDKYTIEGYVFDNNNNEPLEEVFIKLYKGNKIIQIKDVLDRNHDFSDKNYIVQTCTTNDGIYNFNIDSNGQYTLVYVKEDYFIETQNIIIVNSNVKVNNIGLIKLFNAGKIVVKLEWGNNPPDLDLICRFEITNYNDNNKRNYCYTFFGNRRCVDTYYPLDNKRGGKNGSEIIEIDTVADYDYFFYVRKYFDISNNTAINEFRTSDIEDDLDYNQDIQKEIYKYYEVNDELIKNSNAKLSLYVNGLRIPVIIINAPNEDRKDYEYNYWGGFCFNGKKGLGSLKIINKFYIEEPPKNICISSSF